MRVAVERHIAGPKNLLHLLLTLLTCGLWFPLWLIIAIIDSRRVRTVPQ